MIDIYVEKYNNLYLRLNSVYNIHKEIKGYFSTFIKDHYFHPKVKAKIWDGKISFYDINNHLLPMGLFNEFVKFCELADYNFKLKFDKKELVTDITEEQLTIFYNIITKGTQYTPRDYQQEAVFKALKYKKGILLSPTGCHAKGSKILMYDGSIKNVEDINVGDKLIGPDGTERNVLKLYSGQDQMYKIIPNNGKSFIVNKDHILHLSYTNIKTKKSFTKVNISLKDYLEKSNWFKHTTNLVYNNKELVFNKKVYNDFKFSPYFLGLYLGDGHTHRPAITTMDDVVVKTLYEEIKKIGYTEKNIKIISNGSKALSYYIVRNKNESNKFALEFKKINFNITNTKNRTKCEDKFIPDFIKYGSIEDRYSVLSGILDSDGYLSKNSYYEIILKSKRLIDDISFISISLGFKVSIKEKLVNNKIYYRLNILGDIEKIPLKVPHKIRTVLNKRQKRFNIIGFKVEKLDIDDYYGFELDKDHLYLDSDGLICHNSGKSYIQYLIIRFLIGLRKNIVLVVPTTSLVEQMYSDFLDYGWEDIRNYCCTIYANQEYDESKPLLISTWQSLQYKEPEFFKRFGCLMIDECLHPDTKITLEDGKTELIKNLQAGIKVKSYNKELNRIEDKEILKIHKNLITSYSEKLYIIEDENGDIWFKKGITGNHEVYTKTGKKRVDTLIEGDEIIEL